MRVKDNYLKNTDRPFWLFPVACDRKDGKVHCDLFIEAPSKPEAVRDTISLMGSGYRIHVYDSLGGV